MTRRSLLQSPATRRTNNNFRTYTRQRTDQARANDLAASEGVVKSAGNDSNRSGLSLARSAIFPAAAAAATTLIRGSW